MKNSIYAWGLAIFFSFIGLSAYTQSSVSGNVFYHDDTSKPCPNVHVYLLDTTGVIVDSAITNPDGLFEFYNTPAGDYVLNCASWEPAGGIDLGDSFLIMLYLFGWYSFTDIQELAADVDGDGDIDWDDYWTIVIGWFVYGYPFPAEDDWVFVDVNVTVGLKAAKNQTISASCTGEETGNFDPSNKGVPTTNPYVYNQTIGAEEWVSVPVFINEEYAVNGINYEVTFNEKYMEQMSIDTYLDDTYYNIENGNCRITWVNTDLKSKYFFNNTPIATINFKTKENFLNGRTIAFDLGDNSHIINLEGEVIRGAKTTIPFVESSSYSFELNQNGPNPFVNNTSFDVFLDEDFIISGNVYSSTGQLIHTIVPAEYAIGSHNIMLNRSDLNNQVGLYIYKFDLTNEQNEKFTITGKLQLH